MRWPEGVCSIEPRHCPAEVGPGSYQTRTKNEWLRRSLERRSLERRSFGEGIGKSNRRDAALARPYGVYYPHGASRKRLKREDSVFLEKTDFEGVSDRAHALLAGKADLAVRRGVQGKTRGNGIRNSARSALHHGASPLQILAGTPPITYTWAWGDGSPDLRGFGDLAGLSVTHAFPLTVTAQSYTVTLSVSNACSRPVTATQVVAVSPRRIFLPLVLR